MKSSNSKNSFGQGILIAWDELFDFGLPSRWSGCVFSRQDNEFAGAAFPLLGFAAGLSVALAGGVAGLIFNRWTGAAVFAVAGWLLLTLKDSGRGDARMSGLLGHRMKLAAGADMILNVAPGVLRFLLLIFIGVCGGYFYFPVMLAGAFGLQAVLVLDDDCPENYLCRNERSRTIFRMAMILCGVPGLLFCRMQFLGALAAWFILWRIERAKLVRNGFSAGNISFCGTAAEWVLLVTGCLLG